MKVYISGAISNDSDYVARFRKAQVELEAQGYTVINPADVGSALPELEYEDYMRIDLFLLDMCDAIYMLKGWNKSAGANRELGYALGCDKILMHE